MQIIEPVAGIRATTGAPWSGVRYFCTWRTGGVSQPPWDSLNLGLHVEDDPLSVQANRARLGQALPASPLWLNQVHGTAVCNADLQPSSERGAVPCADAAITTHRNSPLVIMTADCLPVVLADLEGTVLGLVHAGWRGLVGGVLENTMQQLRMQRPFAQGWRAWIGPAIGPSAFEVGPEVRIAFMQLHASLAGCFIARPGSNRWLADLAGLARMQLQWADVTEIESSGECTWSQAERYFSYRRQAQTGRQATLAWLV